MSRIEDQVRAFIVDRFLFGQGGETLSPDDSFLDRGIIDSTGVLELVAYLEEAFSITVDDKELVPDNLDSIRKVAGFVERKSAA